MRIAAILFDLGDVIMKEDTLVREADGTTTLRADLVDGMGEALRTLKARGHRLAIVSDTRPRTPGNILRQHGLYSLFDAFAISEEVGCEKPDPRIFLAALDALRIKPHDFGRVLMVGNNPPRDVRGANRLGLVSVWFHWNDKCLPGPDAQDLPRHEVSNALELLGLIERLEQQL